MNKHFEAKWIVTCLLLAVGAVFFLGAKDGGEAGEDHKKLAAAKLNGDPITLGYMEALSSKQNPALRKELANEEKRMEFLDKVIEFELLAMEAERRGYNDHPEVSSVVKNQLATLMHGKIADAIHETQPTDGELKKKYEEDAETYHKPEMVRARHIVLEDKDKAESLLKELIDTNVTQQDFRRKAQDISQDEDTKSRGGDLTFFTRVDDRRERDPIVDPAITQAAFSLTKNGDLHKQLVKTDKGYHIIMRTGYRDKTEISFEQAQKRLTILLKRDTRKKNISDKVNAIGDRIKVDVFEENLKHVVIDLSSAPNEKDLKPGTLLNRKTGRQTRIPVPPNQKSE